MHISQNQDKPLVEVILNDECEKDKDSIEKLKKSIEYDVVPEVEQYLHRISKAVNTRLAFESNTEEEIEEIKSQQSSSAPSMPLGERH